MNYFLLSLFALVNLLSGLTFAYDKYCAINNKARISERRLHFLELMGGVFLNIILLFLLKHKNKKFAYYFWTCWILVAWIAGFYFYITLK